MVDLSYSNIKSGGQATLAEDQLPVEFLQDLVLGSILSSISISDLKEEIECTLAIL